MSSSHQGRLTMGPLARSELPRLELADVCACCGVGKGETEIVHFESDETLQVRIPVCMRCAPHVRGTRNAQLTMAVSALISIVPLIALPFARGMLVSLLALGASGVLTFVLGLTAMLRIRGTRSSVCTPRTPAVAFETKGDAVWLLFANETLARETSLHTGKKISEENG